MLHRVRNVTMHMHVLGALALAAIGPVLANGQAPTPSPYTCTMLASERTEEAGCYIVASDTVDSLASGELYWHLYTYRTRDEAQTALAASTGLVAESLGKVWLFAIAPRSWRPPGGQRVSVVGPLPRFAAKKYEVRYLEVVEPAGRTSHTPVHRHPGLEAWYVVNGQHCAQTPGSTKVIHAGQGDVIPRGVPMMLTPLTSTQTERHITLVLLDADQPWTTRAADWKPESSCPTE